MASPLLSLGYHLGCPVWLHDGWKGNLLSTKAKQSDWLHQYSQVFNTVEGNSVYHALPKRETVERWAAETADGFRFALKFPKIISHDSALLDAEAETAAFLDRLAILQQADRLGPSFLQLGPAFSARQFDALANYLRRLPTEFPYAVEVRHASWYDEDRHEQALDELLRELNIDKVLFDSRQLHSAPAADDSEHEAQSRKPKTPIRHTVTGVRPMLRLIGRNQVALVQPWIDEWAPVVAGWISQGLKPYVFVHAPDSSHAPTLCRKFHKTLEKHCPTVEALPAFHGESELRQQSLF